MDRDLPQLNTIPSRAHLPSYISETDIQPLPKEMPRLIESIDLSIGDLDKSISFLLEKISPILNMNRSSPAAPKDSYGAETALGENLASFIANLQDLKFRVDRAIGEVEL